jgi:hypothetical protein
MKKYLYINHQSEGLGVFGPYDLAVLAENALLVDVLNTLADRPGATVEDENESIINDAWSNRGFELTANSVGTDDIHMYLREIEVPLVSPTGD